eukprot:7162593-Prymnesium_polylepis.1
MQRDRLQACLLEEIAERYAHSVSVTNGVKCIGLSLEGERPALTLAPCEPVVSAPGAEPDGCDVVRGDVDGPRTAHYDLI